MRLRELDLFCLKNIRPARDHIAVVNFILLGEYRGDRARLVLDGHRIKRRDNRHKLKSRKFHLNMMKHFFFP